MVDAVRSVISMVWGLCYTPLLGDEIPDEMQGCVECQDDQAFCESMGGGAGRSIICREDKPILRIFTYFSEDKYLLFLSWKKSSAINLATSGQLVCQEMLPYPGLSVDLCHQLVTHRAVDTVRSTFLRGSLCCFTHAQPSSLQTPWTSSEVAGEKSWLTFTECIIFVNRISSHFIPIWNHLTQTLSHPQRWPTAQLPETGRAPFLLQCFPTALYWQSPTLCPLWRRNV